MKSNQFKVVTASNFYLADSVIISSGVIGTNLLFLERRIGGINDVFLESFNVGTCVKDHANVRINVRASMPVGSLNEINESFLAKSLLLSKHLVGQGS